MNLDQYALQMLAHLTVIAVLPPLLFGVINKTKAFFGGRVGPPLLQPYYDLAKLLRKGSVFSFTTTWIFRAGPVVGLSTALAASLLVPFTRHDWSLSFSGNVILFAYLFALGRFFTTIAALDTGSAFEGMGAAREVTYACLTEPAFFFGLVALVRITGKMQFSELLAYSFWTPYGLGDAAVVLVLASWMMVLLAENCRIPFDDPNTHLELTMIHEVMVLDHGGPALGMIEYAAAVKLFTQGAVIARIALPIDTGNAALDMGLFVISMLGLSVVIGVVESVIARLRLPAIPNLLATACVLSAFGAALLLK